MTSPIPLTSGGVQNQGESLLLTDSSSPASPILSTSVLVVVGNQVTSEGRIQEVILGVSAVGATTLTLDIPTDGVYSLQGVRVEQASTFLLTPTVGDTLYYLPQGALYQYRTIDPVVGPVWTPILDTSYFYPLTGTPITYLHLTSLIKVYNKLLLRYLYWKLGPLEGVSSVEAALLDKHLGRLERGLEGSKYLFQDQNYTEASRTVELLTLTRYL